MVNRRYLVPFLLLIWLVELPVLAQADPYVEIVLSDTEAPSGSTIFADLVVRNGTAIAGADIGITVDGTCLRVVGREDGNYLPTSGETGGFSPFEEMSETTTRFAANVTDRARIANGDGVFFRVVLETFCEAGTGNIEITYAQLAALTDPSGGSNDLTAFSLERGNLPVNSVHVAVAADAEVAEPAGTLAPLPTQPESQTTAVSVAPEGDESDNDGTLLIIAVVVAAIAGVTTVSMFAIILRSRRRRG